MSSPSILKSGKGLAVNCSGDDAEICPATAYWLLVPMKSPGRWVRGVFCVLPSEMGVRTGRLKLCRGVSPDIRPVARGITPASHVNRAVKSMTNAGRASAAGMVPGACLWSGT